jgi:hypothetical protein
MGVQPLSLEDRIEIVDPDYRVPDEFPVIPEDTFMGMDWGRFRTWQQMRDNFHQQRHANFPPDRTIFDDIVHEWFGNVNHHQTIEFTPDHGWYVFDDGIYRYRSNMFPDRKEQDRKAKKEKEYKDLMNQILNYVAVSYKCNYCVEKEVEHSYPPSAPISFLVR